MDKQISQSIDFLRFPLACGVVVLHLMGSYTNWTPYEFKDFCRFTLYDHLSVSTNILFQIAVPVFFFISGYLFSRSYTINFKEKIRKKTKSILVPFLIWNIMAYLLFVITKVMGIALHGKNIVNLYDTLSPLFILKSLFGDFTKGFPCSPIDEPLWFMRDLYVLFLFTPILLFFLRKLGCSFLCALMILYVLNVKGYPCLQVQSVLFFSLGLYLRVNAINYLEILEKNKKWLLSVAVISFFVRYMGGLYELSMPIFIISASCCLILFSAKKTGRFTDRIIAYKKYSFWIYALHFLLIQKTWGILYYPILRQNQIVASISYIVSPIIVIIICILLYNVMYKYFPRQLSWLVGLR